MKFGPVEFMDKKGRTITLRSGEVSDAKALIQYMKDTAGESRFLLRSPEEITFTPEREAAFILNCKEEAGNLMLVAEADGALVGTCSFAPVGTAGRVRHRCSAAIALYQAFWGAGIGTAMFRALLAEAKKAGYEQAELEVASESRHAIALYERVGFQKYGTLPRFFRYADGTYADADWMMKLL